MTRSPSRTTLPETDDRSVFLVSETSELDLVNLAAAQENATSN